MFAIRSAVDVNADRGVSSSWEYVSPIAVCWKVHHIMHLTVPILIGSPSRVILVIGGLAAPTFKVQNHTTHETWAEANSEEQSLVDWRWLNRSDFSETKSLNLKTLSTHLTTNKQYQISSPGSRNHHVIQEPITNDGYNQHASISENMGYGSTEAANDPILFLKSFLV